MNGIVNLHEIILKINKSDINLHANRLSIAIKHEYIFFVYSTFFIHFLPVLVVVAVAATPPLLFIHFISIPLFTRATQPVSNTSKTASILCVQKP